ncbi:monocarboxylate transporter 4-like [Mizuhopecten yessoensis]|uniref:monocarboxylate transporter 4-like n=1 Tax=Mizuhopecten yessoensis TaxID=6573 RepID=UPI000B45F488|nr:monocarboxylate transporter 4-like [Mizuhopecten yessoensis]
MSVKNASIPVYTFNPSQGYTGHADHTLAPDQIHQGGTDQDIQGPGCYQQHIAPPPSQGYIRHADHTVAPDQIHQGGTDQDTQGPDNYQQHIALPPPQPAFPKYNDVYISQQPANQPPTSQRKAIQQHSNTNANNIPSQSVSFGNTSIRPLPSASQQQRSYQRPRPQQGNKDTELSRPDIATVTISVTKGRRPSRKEQTTKEGTEMEVADGNLALELPAAGSTIEKLPDGGFAAWRVVAACATLNACSSTCLLMLSVDKKGLEVDIGEDETDSITTACTEIRLLAAPLVAIAIVLLGYRKVAIIGSIMVSVGFFISGFLNADLSGLMGVLLGGIAGLGLACWYLCAIIPILEYFEKRRLIALMLTNLGSIVVIIIIIVLLITGQSLNWEVTFKCMVIPGVLGLIASFFLQPLELKMKDTSGRTFVQTILGVLDIKLFKDFMLYLVMLLYFFDQFGRGIPLSYITPMMSDKSFSLIAQLIQLLLIPVGSLIGYVAVIFWKSKWLIATLLLWGPMDLFVGFLTLQMPAFDKFGWVAAYSVIFGFTQAVVSSLLNNAVPDVFGVHNIRIVEGLLGFSAGLGEIVASPAAEDAISRNDGDEYSAAFYLAASMLLAAGVIALVARYIIVRKTKNNASVSNTGDNDGKEADDDETDGDYRGDKTRRETKNRKQHKADNSNGHDSDVVVEDVDISDTEYM